MFPFKFNHSVPLRWHRCTNKLGRIRSDWLSLFLLFLVFFFFIYRLGCFLFFVFNWIAIFVKLFLFFDDYYRFRYRRWWLQGSQRFFIGIDVIRAKRRSG